MIKTISKGPIPLFFWSERRFSFKDKENYGDLLSKYLVEKISGRSIRFVHPVKQSWYKRDKKNFLATGSIIHHASKDSVVWGSGIIDRKQFINRADFRAVRGPRTRKYLLGLGYSCPKVYGDPAILLPKFYSPKIEKKYKLGVVPHYLDYAKVNKVYKYDSEVSVIDLMTLDTEEVTRKILQCEVTVSSSLHGIIISHAYNIPCLWVEFSKDLFGDGVKFFDYFESVDLPTYKPEFIDYKLSSEVFAKLEKKYQTLPKAEKLEEIQTLLLEHCPFI